MKSHPFPWQAGLIAAALTLTTPAAAAFNVDGSAADWAAIAPLATATSQSATTLKAAADAGCLYVLVEGQGLTPNYNLLPDTDDNAASGHQSGSWAGGSGADYLVSGGGLYRSLGSGWEWAATGSTVEVAANGSVLELRVPLSALAVNAQPPRIRLGFQALSASWLLDSQLPASAAFASLGPAAGPAFPVGKGMIIPACLTLDDLTNWNILKEGAAQMQAGSNPAFRDYWVAVNSGANGPFTAAAEWTRAAGVWNPIRANGGRIFGYVHTCVEPTGPHFRSLATVQAEIAAWVAGYPQLDGIWLDEFYPRFELADVDGVPGPNYPNGVALAPTDRGFVNAEGQFNGVQVQPAGGYYDQLTRWIRQTYPQLRIIGNTGGAFYSNQLRYSDLVDVLVSFEQNLDVAANAPVNDWSGLNRQLPAGRSGQLALIHRNSTNLAGAVDQALAHGYTHVYTTDRHLESNIWGGIPPYLSSEIQYVSNQP